MAKSLNVRNTHGEVRMTDGSLWKNMLIFSAPLMLSQLLQVLFNMADVAIVGKYSSAEALGAVGSTTILVTLFTGFLIGMLMSVLHSIWVQRIKRVHLRPSAPHLCSAL